MCVVKFNEYKLKIKYKDEKECNQIFLIDLENEQEIGYISFKLNNSPYKHAWLYKIEIEEKYQCNGFGTLLLKLFENYCIDNKIDYVEGKYYPLNKVAKPFYLKNNYKIEKEYYDTYVVKNLKEKNVLKIDELSK